MNVTDAIDTRRAIRRFSDKPVDRAVLERILETAQLAPSGGNLQPWAIALLTGNALADLETAIAEKLQEGRSAMQLEHPVYPEPMTEPYKHRHAEISQAIYGSLGIARDDKAARFAEFKRNFTGFGAPVLGFLHIDKAMERAQWADMGIYLGYLTLLLREAGLDSCPQAIWVSYGPVLHEQLGLGDERMIWAGMAIGYAEPDEPVNSFPRLRAPLNEVVSWRGWD